MATAADKALVPQRGGEWLCRGAVTCGIVGCMGTIGWRWSGGRRAGRGRGETTVDFPWDGVFAGDGEEIAMRRADCCVASAVYRVVLPASGSGRQQTELLLCAHHYHQSQGGLQRVGAAVYDANNCLV